MDETLIPVRNKPVLKLESVLAAISSPTRWAVLRELASGNPLAVVELAVVLGQTPAGMSKHMGVLRDNQVVNLGRNRLYSLPPQFILDRKQRIVDFGWGVLRLNESQGPAVAA